MAIASSPSYAPIGDDFTCEPEAIARVPRSVAFRFDILPVAFSQGMLHVVIPAPADPDIVDHVRSVTRLPVRASTLARDKIRERLRTAYGVETSPGQERRTADVPAVRAVDAMFARAIGSHASDIHVEPHAAGGRVRLRVDGILRDIEAIPPALFAPLVSRIKLLAGMDIADRRAPQDGRYSIPYEGREIDARVSSIPAHDGEKLVIRLLDRHAQAPDLARLGMPADLLAAYRSLVEAPWGFIVVTGPTGSGKTTTLYASIAELDRSTRNVCTVEDPIEMRLGSVTQVQVNTRSQLTFPTVLRAFMRQDPNVIMVGEMRDAETASVAIAASLAGQLVFTTLHANDAPRTIERLAELGVARHALAAGLSGVIAQRLVRRLCERCRIAVAVPNPIRATFPDAPVTWYEPGACRACSESGFVGRTGVYELLVISDDVREAIAAGASSVQLAHLGRRDGYRPMFADGLAKVFAGETSFTELSRVVAWNVAS